MFTGILPVILYYTTSKFLVKFFFAFFKKKLYYNTMPLKYSVQVTTFLRKELADKIEKLRKEKGFSSRSKLIEWLIEKALNDLDKERKK